MQEHLKIKAYSKKQYAVILIKYDEYNSFIIKRFNNNE